MQKLTSEWQVSGMPIYLENLNVLTQLKRIHVLDNSTSAENHYFLLETYQQNKRNMKD